ncbi:MAG: tripartite tricarboxylate transporter substrate binding protein [Burkholderiales bacterium]|nr:tripartite tricarboxylate transporter substrate binding protein [Burkholderiales bacterium]
MSAGFVTRGKPRRRERLCALALLAFACFGAHAQGYPAKPLRMIVPLPPGSTGEALARLVAENLRQRIDQSVVVDTRPGASGQIGVGAVVRSPPDGYTIMVASVGPITINPALYGAKLGFDPVTELAPITQIANTTSVLLVHPSLPVRGMKEFIAFARARPGQLLYSSAGNASTTHFNMVLLGSMTGVKLAHVPYKGSTQGLIAVASGETQLMITGWVNSLPLAKSGKVRLLAVVSAQRNAVAPGLPAIGETVPGYEAEQWYGVFAPAGTSQSILSLLHAAIVKDLQTPEARSWFANAAAVPIGNTPQEFGARIRAEFARWTKIIRESGMKPE